ncbi:MAG: glycosyltransferase family 2 protein [Phycisphaerales bacterium JB059]
MSVVIPTRNRNAEVARTLAALDRFTPEQVGEVIVVDNASDPAPETPRRLARGQRVELIRLEENLGAAARNVGAERARGAWVLMLDDDSHPSGGDLAGALARQDADVGAVTMDIHLPAKGVRESGGLPEVPIGCGVAYRREAFLGVGGYDASFGYYAEEYDLSAKLLLAGWRVRFELSLRVEHRMVEAGRDMGLILGRLVRNNGWVLQRYAPEGERRARLEEMVRRYEGIAHREGVVEGFASGLAELERTIEGQERAPMPEGLWDRFTGLSAAREGIGAAHEALGFGSARLVARGKHDWVVERALRERGVTVGEGGEVDVIGTLSPGPMLDAQGREPRAIAPWEVGGARRGIVAA